MSRERRAEKHQRNDRSMQIYVEIVILLVAVIASMATPLIGAYHEVNPLPFVSSTLLRIAQIIEAFVIALAALGLMYKGLRMSRMLRQLQRSVKELTELSEVRETFIHMAQHRLRTPLSGVRWALGSLEKSPQLSDKELELVAKSKSKMEKAEELVEKMMKLHKSDLSDFELSEKKDQIDLSMLIKDIIDDLDYLARDKGTEVSFEEAVQATVNGDRYLLKSALTNIVDNAIRYSPGESVTILLQSTNDGVKIVVSDTGIGISPTEQDHIFERFYRGNQAQAIDPNQSGIGMYLSKQAIGMHGGSINVHSVEAEGTTFTITLPQD